MNIFRIMYREADCFINGREKKHKHADIFQSLVENIEKKRFFF